MEVGRGDCNHKAHGGDPVPFASDTFSFLAFRLASVLPVDRELQKNIPEGRQHEDACIQGDGEWLHVVVSQISRAEWDERDGEKRKQVGSYKFVVSVFRVAKK